MKAPLLKTQYQGVWYTLHLESFLARTISKQKEFLNRLMTTIKYLPCEHCSKHAQKYIDENPPKLGNSISHSGASSIFVYMYEFHNYVNKRLDKPLADFQTIYTFYRDFVQSRNDQSQIVRSGVRCQGCS